MEERIQMIREVLKDQSHLEVESFNGLLVDYVIQRKTNVVIRGLRLCRTSSTSFRWP